MRLFALVFTVEGGAPIGSAFGISPEVLGVMALFALLALASLFVYRPQVALAILGLLSAAGGVLILAAAPSLGNEPFILFLTSAVFITGSAIVTGLAQLARPAKRNGGMDLRDPIGPENTS